MVKIKPPVHPTLPSTPQTTPPNKTKTPKVTPPIAPKPPTPPSQPKKGRKIVSIKHGPSIKEDPSLDDENTKFHAERRQQTIAIVAVAYKNTALRSDGSTVDRGIKVGGAYFQVGKGKKEGDSIRHAAHCDPTAGIRDQILDQYCKEIAEEQTITPIKEAMLKARGVDLPNLDKIKAVAKLKNSSAKLQQAFKDLGLTNKQSIIDGTNGLMITNATTVLPADVNKIDSDLERKIRPQIEKLYTQISKNEITIDELIDKSVTKTQEFFKNEIAKVEKELKNPHLKSKPKQKLQKRVRYLTLELEGTKKPDLNIIAGSLEPNKKKRRCLSEEKLKEVVLSDFLQPIENTSKKL